MARRPQHNPRQHPHRRWVAPSASRRTVSPPPVAVSPQMTPSASRHGAPVSPPPSAAPRAVHRTPYSVLLSQYSLRTGAVSMLEKSQNDLMKRRAKVTKRLERIACQLDNLKQQIQDTSRSVENYSVKEKNAIREECCYEGELIAVRNRIFQERRELEHVEQKLCGMDRILVFSDDDIKSVAVLGRESSWKGTTVIPRQLKLSLRTRLEETAELENVEAIVD